MSERRQPVVGILGGGQLARMLALAQALAQVDYPGWLIGLVHRHVPLSCATHGRIRQGCAEADNKPIGGRLSCPFPPVTVR